MNPIRQRRVVSASDARLAAKFTNSTGNCLTIASNSSLQLGGANWTIVGWAKFVTVNAYRKLVVKEDAGGWEWGVQLNPTGAGGNPGIEAFTGAGNAEGGAVTAGPWYFFMARWTDNIGVIECSVNNAAAGSNAGNIINGNRAFGIGNDGDGGGTNGMDGLIDAVGIWNRGLSGAEVTALYNGGLGVKMSSLTGSFLTNLISTYDFNDTNNIGKDGRGTNNLVNTKSVTTAIGLT